MSSSVLVHHADCLSKDDSAREQMQKCMDKYVVMLKHIRDHVEPEKQFPAYCCAFEFFRECIYSITHYLCNSRTGVDTAKYVDHKLLTTQKAFADIQGCVGDKKQGGAPLCGLADVNVTISLARISQDELIAPQYDSPVLIFMDIAAGQINKKRYPAKRKFPRL